MGSVDGNNDGVGFGVRGVNTTPANFGNLHEAGVIGTAQGGVGVFGTADDITSVGVFGSVGRGVQGVSPDGVGVEGISDTGHGVNGNSNTNNGVSGFSRSGTGVFASSDSGNGIRVESTGDDALVATTSAVIKSAVFATNNNQDEISVFGGNGVFGQTLVRGGVGVFGANNSTKGRGVQGNGPDVGVGGFSQSGTGVLAQSGNTALLAQAPLAGRFEGKVLVVGGPIEVFEGDINVTGSISVSNNISARTITVSNDISILGAGGDVAEQFEVNAAAHYEPGMLMVIGENGALEPCASPYDKRAIGVISGAGTLRPAVTLSAFGSHSVTAPIALVGTAFCWMDAGLGPINAGDLVTSSETPGHAMRAADPMKSFGAIVGKALAPLHAGRALVPMVISLQ